MKKGSADVVKIDHLLRKNTEEVIEHAHLRAALLGGKCLRVKFGIDPTGPKIHMGRAVVLWKLREFQDLGHKIVFIIGDTTAEIGDPSDKLSKRPVLSKAEVKKNLKGYLPQVGKIIDLKKAEVRYNSEWLSKLDLRDVLGLTDLFTVSQMIERRNFKERWEKKEEICLREVMYPLMQGYDSVAVKADVEIGGFDQLFNLLAGRKIQQAFGMRPQDIMTTKMLLGTDGRKMSTSWGNVINIVDSADEQFGKIMSIRDNMIHDYLEIATDLPEAEIEGYKSSLKNGSNPKSIKEKLAEAIVSRYHGHDSARKSAEKFSSLFSKKNTEVDLPNLNLPTEGSVIDLVVLSGAVKSRGEARRLVEQGGFYINGKQNKNSRMPVVELSAGDVVKIGKKSFFRLK